MRTTLLAIATGFALSACATAFAAETQPTVAAQPIAAANSEPKPICHYLVHEGRLMPKPVCASQRVWDETRRETEQTVWRLEVRSYSQSRH